MYFVEFIEEDCTALIKIIVLCDVFRLTWLKKFEAKLKIVILCPIYLNGIAYKKAYAIMLKIAILILCPVLFLVENVC